MAEKTGIAWCDSTFNPWIGCTKVGPGCDHCYAEVQDSRKRWGGTTHWGPGALRHRTSASNWAQPLTWNKLAEKSGRVHRVFCASLADVFDNEVDPFWRRDLWSLIERTANLSWLLVTKRIGNVRSMMPSQWVSSGFPDHVRILITVCNQEEADRDIPKLLALRCKNGISYEPALGPVDFSRISLGKSPVRVANSGDYSNQFRETEFTVNALKGAKSINWPGINWVIIGGESGPKARPFSLEWARSTVAQCKSAGVPVFVKQFGRYPMPESGDLCGFRSKGHSFYRGWPLRYCDEDERISVELKDRAGADPSEWPEDLRIREFPV